MSILNYNGKLFFMFDAIRGLILGMSAGIMCYFMDNYSYFWCYSSSKF